MMSLKNDPLLETALAGIAARANALDQSGGWVMEDLQALAAAGAMRWAIPASHGGDDLNGDTLQTHYESIASASLATGLAFSQRDAAVGFIEAAENTTLRDDLLPKLARNEVWTTIGISHLTTSTQPGALAATIGPDGGIELNGNIPWSTGAAFADFLVAAARVPGGEPVVFVLPTDYPGVTVGDPLPLAALTAAHTSAVHCESVRLGPDLLLTGPAADAMGGRSRSVRVSQAFAALGLATAALRLIDAIDHPSARTTLETLQKQLVELRHSVHEANHHFDPHDLQTVPMIRSELNSLALRSTHAAVTLHKGAALRVDHPAQRLAREALFLLVWSSPMSVVDRNLELLS
ncbi:MAG TPA: acyl-CoA dehydrogenase family protein [Tepidisphaeraceae bacterium]|jgi:alkylation response protein AidB-like acyl-CoA dehydrogenase